METVSITRLKAEFAAFSKRAGDGETFIVTRYGKPLFRLAPPEKPPYRYVNSGIVGGDPAEWTAPPFTDEELESFGITLRALIATGLTLNAPIISFDRQLARYEGVDLRWD